MTAPEPGTSHSHGHDHEHPLPHAGSAEEPAPPTKPRKQEQEDPQEELSEVAPGVLRAQLPLNLPGLGHVNCYVLEDERGIAVVDPGMPDKASWAALKHRLAQTGATIDDIHTIVVTHSHFDHFGAADRIRENTDAELLTHELFRDAFAADELDEDEDSSNLDMTEEQALDARIDAFFSQRLPWGTQRLRPKPEDLERMKRAGRFGNRKWRTPKPSISVTDAQVVELGGREWVSVHTPGHTNDHLCLWDPVNGVMFSGDHVLPTITPHIGGMSPVDDPLEQFFESLRRMASFDGVQVALPAHGHPFADLGGRAEAIIDHHQDRLDIIRKAAPDLGDTTVTDYMRVLFRERSWGDMAESETFAHLVHLAELGELERSTSDGVVRFG